jgi:hypothetical protein
MSYLGIKLLFHFRFVDHNTIGHVYPSDTHNHDHEHWNVVYVYLLHPHLVALISSLTTPLLPLHMSKQRLLNIA